MIPKVLDFVVVVKKYNGKFDLYPKELDVYRIFMIEQERGFYASLKEAAIEHFQGKQEVVGLREAMRIPEEILRKYGIIQIEQIPNNQVLIFNDQTLTALWAGEWM